MQWEERCTFTGSSKENQIRFKKEESKLEVKSSWYQ